MRKIQLFFFTIIIIQTSFGQDYTKINNPTSIINKLKSQSAETLTTEADFTEEKHLSYLKEPQISNGKFYFKRNDKIKWVQLNPESYIMLINGDNVRIQENGIEKQLGSSKFILNKIKNLMVGLMKGDIHSSKQFESTYYESSTSIKVNLKTLNKQMAKSITAIELIFDEKSLKLNELTFHQLSGDRNTMKFTNQKINENINNIIFESF